MDFCPKLTRNRLLQTHCFRPPLLLHLYILSFIFLLLAFLSPHPVSAQSFTLNGLRDVVSDKTLGNPATHSVSFQLPNNAQPIIATDYIQINLPYFNGVTAPNLVAGVFSGTPVYSVDGWTAQVTGINVTPGNSVTIEGIFAYNPILDSNFQVVVSITEDEEGLLVKNTASTVSIEYEYLIDISAQLDATLSRLRIEGYTAPYTYVLFTEGSSVRGTDLAGPTGYFAKVFPALTVENHTFSFYGIDSNNLTTTSKSVTVYTPANQLITITDQLLSPTLTVNDTSITSPDPLIASGSAYPGSTITIFTDTPVRTYTASASASGNWGYSISDIDDYVPGDYRIFSLAQSPSSLQSLISPTIIFTVSSPSGSGTGSSCGDISTGDLNCDAIVDLTDFSILMYYWGLNDATADINADELVDLTDFSIMMYYWGT